MRTGIGTTILVFAGILAIALIAVVATLMSKSIRIKQRPDYMPTNTLLFNTTSSTAFSASALSALNNTSILLPTTPFATSAATATITPTSSLSPNPEPKPTPAPPKETSHTFHIDISNQRQHVGAWYGTFIRDNLLSFLKPLCSRKRKSTQTTCEPSSHKYKNIEHPDDNGHVKKTSGVEATLSSSFFPPDAPEDLHEAFIAQIADTYMIATLSDGNCFKYDRKATVCIDCKEHLCLEKLPPSRGAKPDMRERIVRWCNAPEYVRVSVTDAAGKETAHMEVRLQFGGKTELGRLDCVGFIDGVDGNARAERVKGLEEGMRDKVGVVVACEKREVVGSCPNAECLYQIGDCFR
ncbi:hypothetical protein IQ07DRAFT_642544 [Pyrenochaeta sp. DS3sAY3a]|nr:hypothetical protein IQ07DRAFT_642544 [Pyrenochaeta sp. DS3sAY3a]